MKKTPKPSVSRFGSNGFFILLALSVVSCITVNVNFPESAVQRAADDFVRDLYSDTSKADSKTEKAKESLKTKDKKSDGAKASHSLNLFDFILPNSYAQEVKIRIPDEFKEKMRSRVADISSLKGSGAICEGEDGLLRVTGKGDSAKAKSVSDAENSDRTNLFERIRGDNSLPDSNESRRKIRTSFAGAFRAQGAPCN